LRLSKNYSQQLKRDKPSPWRGHPRVVSLAAARQFTSRWHLRKQMTDEGTARSTANVVILPFCRLRGPSSVGFAASFSPREKPYPAQAFCCNTSIKRTFFDTLKNGCGKSSAVFSISFFTQDSMARVRCHSSYGRSCSSIHPSCGKTFPVRYRRYRVRRRHRLSRPSREGCRTSRHRR